MKGRPNFFASSSSFRGKAKEEIQASISASRIGALGDTLLHLTFRYNSLAKVRQILAALDMNQLSQMAKTVNHEGQLPLQVIKNNPGSAQEKEEMISFLLPYTLPGPMKKWKHFASVTDLARAYPYPWSRELYRNFRLACLVFNKTRHLIEDSATHPRANEYDENESDFLNCRINLMRDAIKASRKRIRKTYAPKGSSSPEKEKLIFEKAVKLIQEHGVGNCGEFSFLGLTQAMKMDKSIFAEAYHIVNNDHAFLVLGRNPASDEADYRTWGSAAVVCDLLSGDIFPAAALPQKLGVYFNFKHQKRDFNLMGFYNPAFHRLAVQRAYNKTTKLTSNLFEELPHNNLAKAENSQKPVLAY